MMLTRRDALGALLAGGCVGAGATQLASSERTTRDDVQLTTDDLRTLTAVAEVVYPSAVTPTAEFVEQYVGGLPASRKETIATTARSLEAYSRRTVGNELAALSPDQRDEILRSMGVDRTGSDPDGNLPERVRYYVVNQLLYGLFTSPRGSTLVGIENPVGHPGGYESYQNPPSADAGTLGGTEAKQDDE